MRIDMPSAKIKTKPLAFRKWAAECLATAEQMSAKSDKARMVAIAELRLRLAGLAETEKGEFGHS
jgi:predicted MarR family transcription regulator